MDKKKGLSPLPFSGNLLVGENRYGKSSEASIEVYLNTKYNNGAERRRVMGIVLLKRRRFEKLARVSMRISFVDPLGCLNHPPPPQPRTKTWKSVKYSRKRIRFILDRGISSVNFIADILRNTHPSNIPQDDFSTSRISRNPLEIFLIAPAYRVRDSK